MSSFPPLQGIRRHLPFFGGALVLTQVPALPLLLLGDRPSGIAITVYAIGSLLAAVGLSMIGIAWWNRIERVVSLVRTYAEEGRLPASREADAVGSSVRQVTASLGSLDRVLRTLESDAAKDPLTGALNRRTCSARLEGDLARSRRSGVPFSVAVFDLDELKKINDNYGHAAGDSALRHLTEVLRGAAREGDWLARWGGDEFVLGLWGADRAAATAVADRIIEKLASEPAAMGNVVVTLGTSVGVAQAKDDDDPGGLFARADEALLDAKRSGRGRVGSA
ncbi:GGDEF domain-containing protein [bacterium]|nr:MAG: GGDEF domain-containing protein [bacterium]